MKQIKPNFRCSLLKFCSHLPSLVLIGIDTSLVWSTTKQKHVGLQNDIKIVLILKLFVHISFVLVFCPFFQSNICYGNQRRLFSGNMPGIVESGKTFQSLIAVRVKKFCNFQELTIQERVFCSAWLYYWPSRKRLTNLWRESRQLAWLNFSKE